MRSMRREGNQRGREGRGEANTPSREAPEQSARKESG